MDNIEKQTMARGLIGFAQDELSEAAFKIHDGEFALAVACVSHAIIMAIAASDTLMELQRAAKACEVSQKLET